MNSIFIFYYKSEMKQTLTTQLFKLNRVKIFNDTINEKNGEDSNIYTKTDLEVNFTLLYIYY